MKAIKKAKTTKKASTMIQITPTPKTAKLMYEMRNVWPKRLEAAQEYFLLDVAGFLLKEIQKKAPKLEMGEKELDYAKHLRIGFLPEGEGSDTIAIYMDGTVSKVTQKSAVNTVLYFTPHGGSPSWVPVLMKHGPWPATAVPVAVKKKDARIVSRKARPDEIVALTQRQYADRRKIEMDLAKAGATNVAVGVSNNGIGVVAHEDLGYNVLRKEFGFDGTKQAAHWRPAFTATKKYAKKAMEKVVKFVKTGDKGVFDLPEHDNSVSAKIMAQGDGFSKEIAPFA